MRDFIETSTHIQCCYARCSKMMRLTSKDKQFKKICRTFGTFAKLCKKHEKRIVAHRESQQ